HLWHPAHGHPARCAQSCPCLGGCRHIGGSVGTLVRHPDDPVLMTAPCFQGLETLATAIVAWQRQHGRHHLPWQGTRDPYRIWLSEIMLQQTQVATVIDYYKRFLERFPTVSSVARADLA